MCVNNEVDLGEDLVRDCGKNDFLNANDIVTTLMVMLVIMDIIFKRFVAINSVQP